MEASKNYFYSFLLSNKSKKENPERRRNGTRGTRDLAGKRGKGDSQNGDKDRFQNKSLFSLLQFPHPSSREVVIVPIS